MGTTVTGLAEVSVDGEPHWAVFNVGDSRVYRYAGGRLRRVTVDHSEVEELVAHGLIDAEEARIHPARHIITRSVGMQPTPSVDVWVLPQTPGERFLLCSDGLTSELTDARIASVLAEYADPDEAAAALVQAVLAEQARDNVTVVVIDVRVTRTAAGDEITVPRTTCWQEEFGDERCLVQLLPRAGPWRSAVRGWRRWSTCPRTPAWCPDSTN